MPTPPCSFCGRRLQHTALQKELNHHLFSDNETTGERVLIQQAGCCEISTDQNAEESSPAAPNYSVDLKLETKRSNPDYANRHLLAGVAHP